MRALTPCSRGQHMGIGELVGTLGPGLNRQSGFGRTQKAPLGPDEPHAAVERGQVSDLMTTRRRSFALAITPHELHPPWRIISIPTSSSLPAPAIRAAPTTYHRIRYRDPWQGVSLFRSFRQPRQRLDPLPRRWLLSKRGQIFTRPSSLRRARKGPLSIGEL